MNWGLQDVISRSYNDHNGLGLGEAVVGLGLNNFNHCRGIWVHIGGGWFKGC